MTYQCNEYSSVLAAGATTSKQELSEWIRDFAQDLLNHYLLTGELPDHFEQDDIENCEGSDESLKKISEGIWTYIRWCESSDPEHSCIWICSEDDTASQDIDLFLQIVNFVAKKIRQPLPSIRWIEQSRQGSTIQNMILSQCDGEPVLKTEEDLMECVLRNQSLFNLIL